jgi:hypothetical protein
MRFVDDLPEAQFAEFHGQRGQLSLQEHGHVARRTAVAARVPRLAGAFRDIACGGGMTQRAM